jgi:uncharacterized membrane protein HdeD (DUF308 family)
MNIKLITAFVSLFTGIAFIAHAVGMDEIRISFTSLFLTIGLYLLIDGILSNKAEHYMERKK